MKKKYVLLILLLALSAIAWNQTIMSGEDLILSDDLTVGDDAAITGALSTGSDGTSTFTHDGGDVTWWKTGPDKGTTADGNSFYLYRLSTGDATGDTDYLQMNISQYGVANFLATQNMVFTSYDDIEFKSGTNDSVVMQASGTGHLQLGADGMGTDNPTFKHYGYITSNDDATAADERYIQWQVEDTNDTFTLSRGSTHVTSFKVDMPFTAQMAEYQYTSTGAISSNHVYKGLVTNYGAGAITLTLPTAATGMVTTILLTAAQDVDVNPADNDQILVSTNSDGDAVSSDATIGSFITLLSVDGGAGTFNWMPMGTNGTWTDAD